MKIQFNIRFHTRYGESLWISGNCKSLGANCPVPMLLMKYATYDYWSIEVDLDESCLERPLSYGYIFKNGAGETIYEQKDCRQLFLPKQSGSTLTVYDTWMATSAIENTFYTAPFKEVLLPEYCNNQAPSIADEASHTFIIKAPLLKENEVVCLLGSAEELHHWKTDAPVLMEKQGDSWVTTVALTKNLLSFQYKYGVFNTDKKRFIGFEEQENRLLPHPSLQDSKIILQDGFIRLPNNDWRGAGVSIPVFSLRSENGLGIGEFNDLKPLADWARETGLKLIQILPVNDTTATFTWRDSYPYAAISAFALHPIYLNIESVAGNADPALAAELDIEKKRLNTLAAIDYEAVLKAKITLLKKIFDSAGKEQLKTPGYTAFFKINQHWLQPYAVFSYLRDKYKTVDYSKWEDHAVYTEAAVAALFKNNPVVAFYCFLQYHLHLQLKDAVAYAHKKGIVIKGDIPIGVFRYGSDTWTAPELYHMELQAGAPPDDFAVNGQNWGFPTYNWQRMQDDQFAWWSSRFKQMSHYFDAFRIDHILGFFRIWSIPITAVQGIMGYFDRAIGITADEFYERGIQFSEDRFCNPFMNNIVLGQLFGDNAADIKSRFFHTENGFDYVFLPEFDTQRKIETWFTHHPAVHGEPNLKESLFQLLSNVLLLKQSSGDGVFYHPRFDLQKTASFQALPYEQQQKLTELYNDYFFRRQDAFWRKESLKKLPQLKAATNMLVCGEDLGLVPSSVPEVMKELGILSLEIQRMPKQPGIRFFDPAKAPYLSVVSPSTHDMSTIRGWWEEDSAVTQDFYTHTLHLQGEAPVSCEGWINREIVKQHLSSPAMWSIFQLQDLLGMDEQFRREHPAEERINIPANPQHYWRYRMHLPLSALLANTSFTALLKEMIMNSGR
ncbi:4-alpha-glucanotransferase [Niabella soli]|uniref:4-alpha-glucanotransferase n=1 Tax=Niabella soli DSM 19437 TaxID=929713 RepID=W0F0L4_9BACT|nr:4-alpha-glucanotransferase [Niabella soli]AHF14989.1 4-alpha-glucanotransferase [Niabella soli DSM 19437]